MAGIMGYNIIKEIDIKKTKEGMMLNYILWQDFKKSSTGIDCSTWDYLFFYQLWRSLLYL